MFSKAFTSSYSSVSLEKMVGNFGKILLRVYIPAENTATFTIHTPLKTMPIVKTIIFYL